MVLMAIELFEGNSTFANLNIADFGHQTNTHRIWKNILILCHHFNFFHLFSTGKIKYIVWYNKNVFLMIKFLSFLGTTNSKYLQQMICWFLNEYFATTLITSYNSVGIIIVATGNINANNSNQITAFYQERPIFFRNLFDIFKAISALKTQSNLISAQTIRLEAMTGISWFCLKHFQIKPFQSSRKIGENFVSCLSNISKMFLFHLVNVN